MFFNDYLCTGQIDSNGTGNGRMVNIDGDVLEGQFIGGQLVKGVKKLADGLTIEGEFINDTIVRGRFVYENRRVEEIE